MLARRTFLAASALAGLPALALEPKRKPRVAAVFTAFAHRWHAHVILENFLEPYLFNGKETAPGVEIVSFYADQFPKEDMAKQVAKDYGIPLYTTIADALRCRGKKSNVDAVLLIGEHGDYPTNAKGQKEYPRKRLFDEVVKVFREDGSVVPIFSDKHLSYRWDWAKEMVDTANAMKIPFLAGSSVPLAQRIPPFELPKDAKIVEAVSIHGGGFESYDIHALEVLQSIVEARRGGETGVKSVRVLFGDELLKAAEHGEWSMELADAAMKTELGGKYTGLKQFLNLPKAKNNRLHGILIRYADGSKGTVLKAADSGIRWNFACKVEGFAEPMATRLHVGPWQNRNLFKALSHAIQEHFRAGKPPWPIERSLMTTGILCASVDSHAEGDKWIDTPYLDFGYKPTDWAALREMGDSWKIITEQTPEPKGITKGGHHSAK